MTHEDRSRVAEVAWSTPPRGGHDDVRLSAQCARGHRTLSRSAVLQWLSSGEHRVVID
jgi:hypothetical protein